MTQSKLPLQLLLVIFGVVQAQNQEPLVCDCSGKQANMAVCGTDGWTYHNICLLKEAQQTDPNLGRRCLGECDPQAPGQCKEANDTASQNANRSAGGPKPKPLIPSFCRGNKAITTAEFRGFHTNDFDGNKDPKYMMEIIGIEHAPYGEEHIKRCFLSGIFGGGGRPGGAGGRFPFRPAAGRPNRPARPAAAATTAAAPVADPNEPEPIADFSVDHPAADSGRHSRRLAAAVEGGATVAGGVEPPSPFGKVCLTDGSTVPNMKVAICNLRMSTNKSLGVRCLGDCSVCKEAPACPVVRKALSEATHG